MLNSHSQRLLSLDVFRGHVIAAMILVTAHGQSPSSPTSPARTYTGHVLQADTREPIAGATVALLPCSDLVGTHSDQLFQTTKNDGAYTFAYTPNDPYRPDAYILATHPGFTSTGIGCSSFPPPVAVYNVDLKLAPAASPLQIDTAVIIASYKTSFPWIHYRDASFTADGNTLIFSTDDGGRAGGLQGWAYDLQTHTLKPGSPQPFQTDFDTIGDYHIELSVNCHGCTATITAISAHDPPTDKATTITTRFEGGAASSDESAFVWNESNSKRQSLIGAYVFATHHRRFIVLPSQGQPMAARPDEGGYLVAYEADGPCAPNIAYLVRMAEDQPFRESPHFEPLSSPHPCAASLTAPQISQRCALTLYP